MNAYGSTSNPTRLLPPDAEQVSLAKEVNAKLGGDRKVTFYRALKPEGTVDYGMVFQYGSARKSVVSEVPQFDVDEIVRDVERWVRYL
jgi:hypothetical protein